MTDLLPCPFCGTAPEKSETGSVLCGNENCKVVCGAVHTLGPNSDPVAAWNTRVVTGDVAQPTPAPQAWCQPMDCGKHTPRKFLLYFDDPDHGNAVFEDEAEARAAFERASTAWNCYLFGAMPLAAQPPAAPVMSLAEMASYHNGQEPAAPVETAKCDGLTCEASRHDNITCADDSCDYMTGVRSPPQRSSADTAHQRKALIVALAPFVKAEVLEAAADAVMPIQPQPTRDTFKVMEAIRNLRKQIGPGRSSIQVAVLLRELNDLEAALSSSMSRPHGGGEHA